MMPHDLMIRFTMLPTIFTAGEGSEGVFPINILSKFNFEEV
jgi:hypothetical protein